MNRPLALGVTLTLLAVAGYVVGVETAYPGRGFSLTAVMVGITLAIISRRKSPEVST